MQAGLNPDMAPRDIADLGTLAERARFARKRLELTQQQLASEAGLQQSDISKIERGQIQRTTAVPALAKALRCNPYWLDTGDGDPEWDNVANTAAGPDIRGDGVPLISWVQAGMWGEIVDTLQPGDAEQWIATTARVTKSAFALRIVGDSMAPKVPDGSIVIFDPGKSFHHGSLVLAKRTGDQVATFKQLWYDGPTPYLKPLNERYPLLEMPEDTRIIAVAVRLELDL
jgi:SOS-response transcriptional repressor LexA